MSSKLLLANWHLSLPLPLLLMALHPSLLQQAQLPTLLPRTKQLRNSRQQHLCHTWLSQGQVQWPSTSPCRHQTHCCLCLPLVLLVRLRMGLVLVGWLGVSRGLL